MPPASTSHYGADEHGLICGYRFDAEGQAAALETAREAAGRLHAPAGFVWLHMNLSHAGAERWLREHAGCSDSFFEALHDGSRSARIERDGDTLFAVINDVTFDFAFDASEVETLWIVVGRRLVVTARRHPLRSVDRLRMAVKRGERIGSTVALLDHLLRDQADELQRIVRQAAERIDDIEDAVLAGHHERHRSDLARLRRLMVRLQRLLAPEPNALLRTLAHPPPWVSADDLEQLRHANEEFALVLRDIAGLQERAKLMQDETAARVSEENNRILFALTIVTVLALPINLISGLFGMNVGGIPLAEQPHGFWVMVAIIGVLTGVIAALALSRIRPRRGRR
jgi:zinc transporter